MSSQSPAGKQPRSQSRTPMSTDRASPRAHNSRSSTQRPRSVSRGRSRSQSLAQSPRHSYRDRSRSRSISRERSRSRSPDRADRRNYRDRSYSRSASRDRVQSSKIVVEKLTKNVTEAHLREIFGTYGKIESIDLPLNRQFMTNRGTAYIVYGHPSASESAIAHMHEAQLDGAVITVSIVLPRRAFSRSPPPAKSERRFVPAGRDGPPPRSFRNSPPPSMPRGNSYGNGRRQDYRAPDHNGRHASSRSPSPPRRRRRSYSESRSPSRTPQRRRGPPARSPPRRRQRSASYSSYSSYSRSRSRSRSPVRSRSPSRSRNRYNNNRR